MQLADTQAAFRNAIVAGNGLAILPRLAAGFGDVAYRLSIHQRHFEASLAKALTGRYPTMEWLLGSAFLTKAAATFARVTPPSRPCIAEYGQAFPAWLAARPETTAMRWLSDLGRLEWHLGDVSVEVTRPALTLEAFAAFDNVPLEAIALTLQPGLRYLETHWPVDDLVRLRLAGDPPEQFPVDPADLRLEIGGARGDFRIERLERGTFAFRAALAGGSPLATALAAGAAAEPTFAPGEAFATIFAARQVTAIRNLEQEIDPWP